MSAESAAARELPELEHFLTYRFHLINKLTDRDSHRVYLEEGGMSLGEGRCLAAIGRFAPLSVNDLARAANLDKGHASRSAKALVERGLVLKTLSESDGRGVVLNLTTEGKTRYRRVIELIRRRNEEVFGCLAADERSRLADLLDRVIVANTA